MLALVKPVSGQIWISTLSNFLSFFLSAFFQLTVTFFFAAFAFTLLQQGLYLIECRSTQGNRSLHLLLPLLRASLALSAVVLAVLYVESLVLFEVLAVSRSDFNSPVIFSASARFTVASARSPSADAASTFPPAYVIASSAATIALFAFRIASSAAAFFSAAALAELFDAFALSARVFAVSAAVLYSDTAVDASATVAFASSALSLAVLAALTASASAAASSAERCRFSASTLALPHLLGDGLGFTYKISQISDPVCLDVSICIRICYKALCL